jgi:lysophospholipase L1-like esterase
MSQQDAHTTIACLGSSTTAARGTFDWIAELKKRPQNRTVRFLNFGVGGDLSYNTLQKNHQVIEAAPDKVLILIGSNDILATVFPHVKRIYILWKRLPQEPSVTWFRENLQQIIRQIKAQTSAQIAVASLAEVGEAPESKNIVQQQLNMLFRSYAEIIKEVAEVEGVRYLPFYERFHDAVLASPGRAFTRFSFLSFYRDYLLREFVLRYNFDKIAQLNGWQFHIDGVHLNTRGGVMLVDLVQEFLTS